MERPMSDREGAKGTFSVSSFLAAKMEARNGCGGSSRIVETFDQLVMRNASTRFWS